MKEQDSYRRDEDRKWREKVDHEQLTLMTAHQVLRDQYDDLKARIKELDEILRGKGKTPGLIAEYERHDEKLTRLYSVVFQDSTGKHGLIHEIAELKGGEIGADRKWKFWTPILVALISCFGLIFTNADKIAHFFGKNAKPDELDLLIKKAKRKKGKTVVRYRVRRATATVEVPSVRSEESVPERRSSNEAGLE